MHGHVSPQRLKRQELSYDPYHLMPSCFPSHPRVLTTQAKLARTKELVKSAPWGPAALDRLLGRAEQPFDLPESLPVPADADLNRRIVSRAANCIVAHHLIGGEGQLERALAAFRLMARSYPEWPLQPPNSKACGGGPPENLFTVELARTYDLLAAASLSAEDDALFRDLLQATKPVTDAEPHRDCGNHNTS
ncbi:unnamed protein product, partial [marine sediment metagenome]